MPMVFAASTISVPAGTVILCPSMVRLTSGNCPSGPAGHLPTRWGGQGSHVALVPQRVVLVLLAEVAERGVDHPARRVTQAAQAAPVLQAVRHSLQRVELDLRTLVGEDPLVCAHRPVAADSTWRALAARLVGVELEQAIGGADDAVLVVHDDHAA